MKSDLDALWDRMEADPDALPAAGTPVPGTLHGMQFIPAGADCIWWAATYDDMAALLEAGYEQTVLLVPGPGMADLYEPLGDHADVLGACPRFVLAGGPDVFVGELARRLGRHRAWLVRWPTGIDGPAHMLREQGEDALREAVEAAEPYPLEGVYRPSAEAMIAYRHRPPPDVMTTGCNALDLKLALPTEGKLIVVTGIPSHGKSVLVRHIACHTTMHHERRWGIYSPEMGEWEDFAAKCIAWLAATPFRALTDEGIAKWAEWCRPRFAFISKDSGDDAPTLDWLIETFTAAVLRDGVTDCLLDPWNQIAHQRGGMTETDYIDMALRRLVAFGRRHGCNVWIIAHPTKLRGAKPGDPLPVPNAYDIAGSAGWFAKADVVLSVYRCDGLTQVHVQKAKFERWAPGGSGDATRSVFAEVEYVGATGRFVAPGYANGPPPDDAPYDQAPEF